MGRTYPQGSAALQITHESGSNYSTFAPGDTIIGHVRRKLPLVSTNATIQVTLCGRAKSKIVISRSNSTSEYRGRFAVVDENAHVQTIFQGPIHISVGEVAREWPFAIDIPTHCCPRRLVNAAPQKQSYLPLDAATVATHRLPDSFHMSYSGLSCKREGFVEYFIKATMSYMHHGSMRSETALLPVNLAMRTNNPPITDFNLYQRRGPLSISSWKLLPDLQNTALTFSQKTQKFFLSSKVPRFGGHFEMTFPRILQIGNPLPIPLRLRFVPSPEERFTSASMRGVPVKIHLSSLHMEIESRTDVRCEGTFSPHEADYTTEVRVQLWPRPPSSPQTAPLYIPCTDEWPAVDVGAELGLRVVSGNEMVLGDESKRFMTRLHPDFVTYNIRHSHCVTFELVAVAAGEKIRQQVQSSLVILPPPGEMGVGTSAVQAEVEEPPPPPFQAREDGWIHPPDEADAPPTFAEVQKEDVGKGKG